MNEIKNTYALADLIQIKHGFAFKGEYFCDGPTPDVLVTPGCFAIGGGFKADNPKCYRGPVPEDYILQPDDLIVTMTDLSKAGDTLGYPALVPASSARYLHNQRIGLVKIMDPKLLDKRFLFYLLRGADYRHHILATASGSTVRHTSPGRIQEFRTDLPTLDEQRAIGGVLGVLDDKIESNRRTSRTLELVARAIFRAWFVDFEPVKAKAAGAQSFPGMPQYAFDTLPTRFVGSKLGPVPDGWEVLPLDEVVEVNPSRRLAKGIPAPYLDMGQMPTDGHAPLACVEREAGSGARFMNGDTLVARITPCLENGKTAFVDFLSENQVAWGSTEYIVLRPKPPIPNLYAYLLARTPEFRSFAIQNMTGTSGRQRVPFDTLSKFHVAVPNSEIFRALDATIQPLFIRSSATVRESRVLNNMRDMLLPHLLSGSVRVQAEAIE